MKKKKETKSEKRVANHEAFKIKKIGVVGKEDFPTNCIRALQLSDWKICNNFKWFHFDYQTEFTTAQNFAKVATIRI